MGRCREGRGLWSLSLRKGWWARLSNNRFDRLWWPSRCLCWTRRVRTLGFSNGGKRRRCRKRGNLRPLSLRKGWWASFSNDRFDRLGWPSWCLCWTRWVRTLCFRDGRKRGRCGERRSRWFLSLRKGWWTRLSNDRFDRIWWPRGYSWWRKSTFCGHNTRFGSSWWESGWWFWVWKQIRWRSLSYNWYSWRFRNTRKLRSW